LQAGLGLIGGTTATLNSVLPGLGISYLCREATGGAPEHIGLQMNVAYRAKPGAQGSHPLCADARKALGVHAAPCGVANHPGQITADPAERYPEDALVKADVIAHLKTIQLMVAVPLATTIFSPLETTYTCTEITDTAAEKESLKLGLTVTYDAKPGAGVQHIMCDQARKALGVTGKCGGT